MIPGLSALLTNVMGSLSLTDTIVSATLFSLSLTGAIVFSTLLTIVLNTSASTFNSVNRLSLCTSCSLVSALGNDS